MMNINRCVRPVIKKTIIKGTIILAVFSLFLEISPSKIINYIIFIVLWYVMLSMYMLWKRVHEYCIESNSIKVRGFTGIKTIDLGQVIDCFVSQGILARRFNCGSIYLILRNGKVIIMRDVPQPNVYYEIICKGINNALNT
ncbi:PH domain-containing protein [Vulcanisaeta sp. JCM 14467]